MDISQDIIEKASQGDHNAFGEIFRMFYPKTHHFALALLKDRHDADDVCQVIFMKLWLRRGRLAGVSNIDGYIFMLAKHAVIDYIAARRSGMTLDDIPNPADNLTPEEKLTAADTQIIIDMVVDNMPRQRQTIYRMSREQNMKNEEIAQALGLSKKTVENHINLALKDIKKALLLAILAFDIWV